MIINLILSYLWMRKDLDVYKRQLENNLNADGSVSIPKALQPYMGGMTKIEKKHA